MTGTRFSLEVRPRVPLNLARLPEVAGNLIYSWDRDLRQLFRYLDNELYDACGCNPTVFLRRVAQSRLDAASEDPGFIEAYTRVTSVYDSYHAKRMPAALRAHLDAEHDLVAYLCLEFGLHESVPLYSGGLGILAGDHCKAASDLALPFVAVGLLYRQGYFEQRLAESGEQVAHYNSTRFEDLPLTLLRDHDGRELRVTAPMGVEDVQLRIWSGRVGHTRLCLLDADLEANSEELRSVTHRLYGGDRTTRIRQEIVLGIGGVRAVRALGLAPTVWHMNEGHAAFQIIERCREHTASGLCFDVALETVAAANVFTTHTPVPAGHDVFDETLVEQHLGGYCERAGIALEQLIALGNDTQNHHLNMTALALRGSRHHNGVSRDHGDVAAAMERYVWPEVPAEENPLTYVTNGVHLPTFLALEWVNLFDIRFRDWRGNLSNESYWACIDDVPDHRFLSVRQELKETLRADVRRRLIDQHRRNGVAEATIERAVALLEDPHRDVLLVGFARRFATYKRATLIFSDADRLARLLGNEERPVVLIMAGKAHPHDEPGQALIRQVYGLAMSKPFLGRVHVVENYDLALARQLVAGVDVWLNTPEHPLEASGTSGMKAAMNGVINLSVLDGWWGEGFDGSNGWAIRPHDKRWDAAYRQHEEAHDLLETLERKVIPAYFDRGHTPHWVAMAKASMKTIIPRFNAERMVRHYVHHLYGPAARQGRRLAEHGARGATDLAAWKTRVRAAWPIVSMRRRDGAAVALEQGQLLHIELSLTLNGLTPADVRVECLVSERADDPPDRWRAFTFDLAAGRHNEGDGTFDCELSATPPFSGVQSYRIRMYPHHALLTHPFEMGRMCWV